MSSLDPKLNELYFGDVEAFDEALLHRDFFEATFVPPDSMSVDALKNNQKFIVVGRKGAGKTAVQMHFARKVEVDEGYYTQFFRFFDDMKPSDYNEITKSQSHISFATAIDDRKIFLNYDYRPAWERIFFNKLAVMLLGKDQSNKFTSFCAPEGSTVKSIFQGIGRSLTIKVSGEMMGIAGELGFDLSHIGERGALSLEEHNVIARQLFIKYCYQYRIYFFIDELVFSRLDASQDEIRVRAAMVRDIIRCARELNNAMALNDIDVHFICSLRPEVRNLINDLDSEIGKVIDGRDVSLAWLSKDEDHTLLDEVLRKKVENSCRYKPIDFVDFFDQEISFGSSKIPLSDFLKTNTWGRPRDVVRLLQAIAKMSPAAKRISEDELKAGLDEYSRASLKELLDELGVTYGRQVSKAIKQGITKKTYQDREHFWKAIGPNLSGFDRDEVIDELFQLGIIQGYLDGPPRYFAAHRGENFLKTHHKIRVHPALWNELGIRSIN